MPLTWRLNLITIAKECAYLNNLQVDAAANCGLGNAHAMHSFVGILYGLKEMDGGSVGLQVAGLILMSRGFRKAPVRAHE